MRRVTEKNGQTVIEYVLVLTLIIMVLILAFRAADLGTSVGNAAGSVQEHLLDSE